MTFRQGHDAARGLMAIIATCVVVVVGAFAFVQFVLHKAQGYTVTNIDDLATHVCDGNQKIKNAAAYTGNAPHHMRVGIESAVLQTKPNLTDYTSVTAPQSDVYISLKTNVQLAEQQFKFFREADTGEVGTTQLVGCITRVHESDTGQKCTYDTGTLEVFNPKYRLNVYIAKTHKLLKSTTLNTLPLDQFNCPSSVYYSATAERVYVPYDSTQFLNILSPLLNGPVRT